MNSEIDPEKARTFLKHLARAFKKQSLREQKLTDIEQLIAKKISSAQLKEERIHKELKTKMRELQSKLELKEDRIKELEQKIKAKHELKKQAPKKTTRPKTTARKMLALQLREIEKAYISAARSRNYSKTRLARIKKTIDLLKKKIFTNPSA